MEGGGAGVSEPFFFTMNPNLKYFFFGAVGEGEEGARFSDFFPRIQIKKNYFVLGGGGGEGA